MSKSVYSVVLDDEVVAAVDLAAMRAGTNRSAIINRLLAAQLQYDTPEERIRTVLTAVEQLAGRRCAALQVISGEAAAQLCLRSALRYKYNPTVKYSLELFAHSPQFLGVLRTQLRTQNLALTQMLEQFYQLWAALEQQTLHTPASLYEVCGPRFSRVLRLPEKECTEQEMAERLTRYVALLDGCMKLYCEHADEPDTAAALTARKWQKGLEDGVMQL